MTVIILDSLLTSTNFYLPHFADFTMDQYLVIVLANAMVGCRFFTILVTKRYTRLRLLLIPVILLAAFGTRTDLALWKS